MKRPYLYGFAVMDNGDDYVSIHTNRLSIRRLKSMIKRIVRAHNLQQSVSVGCFYEHYVTRRKRWPPYVCSTKERRMITRCIKQADSLNNTNPSEVVV